MNTLREAVTEYLTMRRSLGFKLDRAGAALFKFVSFMEERGASYIQTSLALEWAQQLSSVQPSEWAKRLSFVCGFAQYQSAIDVRTEIPSSDLLPHRVKRPRPYVYTDNEIRRLLEAALNLPRADIFKRQTYYCLLGLLSVTGMRIGEALNLKMTDVDLTAGILTVEGAKFGKSRLVPLHASTQKVLSDYKLYREEFLNGRPSAYFFISRVGTRLARSHVTKNFHLISRQCGIREPGAKHGPRLHDMRHRFAHETLLRWYRSGEDAERRLPVLSTYLGHVNVNNTYWYLTAFPELMVAAVGRLEKRWEVQS